MVEKEERILHQDAYEANEHAETLQEMKIYNAMRGGIMQGKKREKRKIYSWGMGVVIAAAATVLLTFTFLQAPVAEVAQDTVRSAVTKEWSDSELFRSVHVNDQSFLSMLDRHLVQPVYHSAEKNGLKVEVMGGATDGRKVFILYSVQNKSEIMGIHADVTLDYGTFKAPSIGTNMTNSVNEVSAGKTAYYVYSAKLRPSVSYPKAVSLNLILSGTSEQALLSSSNKYRTELDIPFELDPDMFKKQQQTLTADRTLMVDGQQIHVRQVEYTPLGTYVDLEYDKNNEKEIFQLINPVLIATTGDHTEKKYYPDLITSSNSEVYTEDSKTTLVFSSTQNSRPNAITLKTFGISAVRKDQMKIVVDFNKQQIIEAPGSTLELVEPVPEYNVEEGEILFRHKIDNAQFLITYTSLSDTFTDADGQRHNKVKLNKTTPGGSFGGYTLSKDGTAKNEISYRFGEKAKDYPQPLTIPIKRYMNPIMDTQAVEVYSKN